MDVDRSLVPYGVLASLCAAGLYLLYKKRRSSGARRAKATSDAERAEAIAQFQSLASCGFEEAREALEASQWELDEALTRAGLVRREPAGHRVRRMSAWALLLSVWKFGVGLLTSLIPGAAHRHPQQPTGRAMRNLFEQRYGNVHPRMQEESLSAALSASKREKLFLVAYLHSPVHPAARAFCQNTLSSDAVSEYIDANFLFWAADVTSSREGYAVANTFRAREFPFVVVLWQIGEQVRVVASLSGSMDVDALISRLIQINDDNAGLLATAREVEAERQNSRVILQQQDDEYEASLRQDRARELAEEMNEEGPLQSVEILPEPHAGDDGAIKLVFRLPHGRLDRLFLSSQRLSEVYAVIDARVAEQEPDLVGSSYRLVTAYPRQIYERSQVSISDSGLSHNSLLLYEELD